MLKKTIRQPRSRRLTRFALERLEGRMLLAGDLLISELMAINNGTLADQDGDYEDWIEIYNPTAAEVDLAEWSLTDDAGNLTKWQFPSETISAGGYLVVFASGKDRSVAGAELHTNFKLDGDGEYLALVESDGTTVSHEFSPGFPQQLEDVSFGFKQEVTELYRPAFTSSASAVLSVDFQNSNGTSIPGMTQTGFEAFDNTDGNSAIYATTAGDVTVTLDGMDSLLDGVFNRGGVSNGGSLTLADIYNDFAFRNGDSSQSMTLTLSGAGIVADADYEFTFYSFDADSTQGSHSVAYSGISGTTGSAGPISYSPASPTTNDQYAVTGTFTSNASGALTIDMTDTFSGATASTGIRLNAIEVAAVIETAPPGEENVDSVVLVPEVSDAGMGTAWTLPSFIPDGDWQNATMPIGIENDDLLTTTTAYGNLVGAIGTQEYTGSLGHDFDVNETITVTSLGVFDSGANGLSRDLTAEIWTIAGVKLASMSFTAANPGELEGSDRFKPLAEPLVLQPGSYSIIAHGYGPGEPNGNEGDSGPFAAQKTLDDGGGVISFVGSGRAGSAGLFPTWSDSGPANRYSAGTFQFAVPALSGLIVTDLSSRMLDQNASALSRVEFSVDDPAAFDWLLLRMQYDDGFVAYLNGIEVARRNAPALLEWNSQATLERSPAEVVETENIDLTAHIGELLTGTNTLAIHGLNFEASDADFLILPELLAGTLFDDAPSYLTPATPGGPNDTASSFSGFVADTTFSVDRGFFNASDLEPGGVLENGVTIATTTDGATIRYTTDGSEPTETNGSDYTVPIAINTTTTLRAAAFMDDLRPTNVDTQTYIFLDSVLAQPTNPAGFPASWRGVTPDYAMEQTPADLARIAGDPNMTAEQYNAVITESLLSLPTMSIVMDNADLFGSGGIYANPGARGSAWERVASVEYILPDGTTGFQIDAGLQIMGGTSRNASMTPKHSLRLVFKKQYGPGRLDYPLFPDAPVESYNTIALRANTRDTWPANDSTYAEGTNSTYIRDQWAKASQAAMGQPATAGNFVHLYLNGLYWGLYNLTERPDAAFLADRTGGDDTDYDAVKSSTPRAIDGSTAKWNQLLNLSRAGLASDAAYQFVQGNNPDGTRNEAYEVLIDVDNIIDYIINGQYQAAVDWPGNYYAVRDKRPESEGFKFFTWDNDLAFPKSNVNMDKSTAETDWRSFWWTASPGVMDMALRENAEYRLQFADHVHRHLFNEGIYTPEAAAELWSSIAGQIEDAVVAESARWGDWLGPLFTPAEHWQPAIDNMLQNYFPFRTDIVLSQMRSHGLYPSVDAPEFEVDGIAQHGGAIDAGEPLGITGPAGDPIYYTTDSTDPRLPGGEVSGSATLYSGPLVLGESQLIQARTLAGGEWSALSEALFTVNVPLRVTEVMYNPDGSDDAEFIELVNTSGVAIPIAGVRFDGSLEGIEFTFDVSEPTLTPGEYIVVVRNHTAFAAKYDTTGMRIALGQYDSSATKLSNDGEQITLTDSAGGLIQQFTYNDIWHKETDGEGFSLVVIDVAADYDSGTNWRSSAMLEGSPGLADPEPLLGNFNGDNAVDRADIVRLLSNFGRSGDSHRGRGDANGDRATSLTDLALLQSDLGATYAAPSPAPLASIAAIDTDLSGSVRSREVATVRSRRKIPAKRFISAAVDAALTDSSFERQVRHAEGVSLRSHRGRLPLSGYEKEK